MPRPSHSRFDHPNNVWWWVEINKLSSCIGSTEGSAQAQGKCILFLTRLVFMARSCQHLAQPPSWRTTPCRLSAAVYSIYSQLHSILEAVPPSATWGRAMPWSHDSTWFTACTIVDSKPLFWYTVLNVHEGHCSDSVGAARLFWMGFRYVCEWASGWCSALEGVAIKLSKRGLLYTARYASH
jgi:hypothetical protein